MKRIYSITLALLLTGVLFASAASAATIGFNFGLNDAGGFAIENTAQLNPWVTITDVTLTFTQGTVYDTLANPFSGATGVTASLIPTDAAADGHNTATFKFYGSDFTVGKTYSIDFGVTPSIGTPDFNDVLIAVRFSDGNTLNAQAFLDASANTIGEVDYDLTAAASQTVAAATPIPAAIWIMGSGLMGLVGMRRRFNK
ncbi:MAG: hypothetical protein KKB70_03235 [Proteobacteria bacterium]|nr:hypothetical protein [Pseudomonadota bacterium]MBU1610791.1 hypothetical protein [Pseudomonadota bacterium]